MSLINKLIKLSSGTITIAVYAAKALSESPGRGSDHDPLPHPGRVPLTSHSHLWKVPVKVGVKVPVEGGRGSEVLLRPPERAIGCVKAIVPK